MTTRFSDLLSAALCLVFAIALQIQLTLFSSDTYLGLRVNLGDLIVPFAGIAILVTLLRKQSLWPQWQTKHVYLWLAGLTLVIAAALVHTHFTYGEISRWALVNKFGGWFMLAALLGLGGWLGTNAKQAHLERFVQIFLYFGFVVIFLELFAIVGQMFWRESFIGYNTYTWFPIHGYMVNRNAFAVLYLAIFALSTCLYFANSPLLKRWYVSAFYFLMPFFLIFNASRAMMIALGIAFVVFLVFNIRNHLRKFGRIFLCFAVGGVLLGILYHYKHDSFFNVEGTKTSFMGHLGDVLDEEETPFGKYDPSKLAYPGDSMRLTILTDAKEMIAERPVTGSGLGSMLLYQKQKHGQMINIIDCTPLWLLVETGLIGFLAFAAFYVQSFRTLYAGWKTDEGFIRTFRLGIIAAMGCFTLMSLFHELMYTRFVWVLLGMGLTLRMRHPE